MKFYPVSLYARINEVDFLRGIAIIAMVIFHWFYLLDLRTGSSYTSHPILIILGYIARGLFIILVGAGTTLSKQRTPNDKDFLKKQFTRVLYLILYALIITLLSSLAYADKYVRFGILHYMSVALSLLSLLSLDDIPKYIPLIISFIMLGVYSLIVNHKYSSNMFNQFILGFLPNYSTIDFFPLFKWLWLSCTGLFIGTFLFQEGKAEYDEWNIEKNKFTNFIRVLGQYSLEIYVLHFIVIYAVQAVLFKKKTL